MISILISLLLLPITLQPSNGGLPIPASVTLSNDIGDGISVIAHCRSKEDDFGRLLFSEGKRITWKFVNWDTYIWCDIFTGWYQNWLNNSIIFVDGNEGYNPEWSIRKDGLYRWIGKIFGFFQNGEARWIKVYSAAVLTKD